MHCNCRVLRHISNHKKYQLVRFWGEIIHIYVISVQPAVILAAIFKAAILNYPYKSLSWVTEIYTITILGCGNIYPATKITHLWGFRMKLSIFMLFTSNLRPSWRKGYTEISAYCMTCRYGYKRTLIPTGNELIQGTICKMWLVGIKNYRETQCYLFAEIDLHMKWNM